jgi:hypothetical protein
LEGRDGTGGGRSRSWKRNKRVHGEDVMRKQLEADNNSARRLSTSPRMCTCDLRARYERAAELPTELRN